jgi:protein-L-isoaspartate O-methyltransferase
VTAPRTLPEVYGLRPWYHDFARLGLRTHFDDDPPPLGDRVRNVLREARRAWREPSRGFSMRRAAGPVASSHRLNQGPKEAVLVPYLERALRELGAEPRCLELFCADGYYACVLSRTRPDAWVTGVDRDTAQIGRARTAARLLECSRATFLAEDIWSFLAREGPAWDLVVCAGGLYHLTEPRALLERLRARTRGFLVVQSVVTLESEDPGYFVSPAPGWRHGSRFSHAALQRWLEELGFVVLDSDRNELPGNPRPMDRGSSYFLGRADGFPMGGHGRSG